MDKRIKSKILDLPLEEIRQKRAECWGIKVPKRIGRKMLEHSLAYKMRELAGQGLSLSQQARLNRLVQTYKKDPKSFDQKNYGIKPGTLLIRKWKDKRCVVKVLAMGFEYE